MTAKWPLCHNQISHRPIFPWDVHKKCFWTRAFVKNLESSKLAFECCTWELWLTYIRQSRRCGHSSVDSSMPSILPPLVWVSSTPSMLLSIYIWFVSCRKDEDKQKEAGIGRVNISLVLYRLGTKITTNNCPFNITFCKNYIFTPL